MVIRQRKEAVLHNSTPSVTCDSFAVRATTLKEEQQITALAYQSWLERAFRNGSPQEDWLWAQRQVQRGKR